MNLPEALVGRFWPGSQPLSGCDTAEDASARRLPRRSDERRIAVAMRNWTGGYADPDSTPATTVLPDPKHMVHFAPGSGPLPATPPSAMRSAEPEPMPADPSRNQAVDFAAQPASLFDFKLQDGPNYYEVLQMSPRADIETIHRIFRIMAARFHPDNKTSGDYQRFLELKEAYEVLSDPTRRAQYDAALQAYETQPLPIFGLKIFVDGPRGEANRRLGVLSLLYQRRRSNGEQPGISVLELENRMGLPREHLEFTLWYLRNKGFVYMTDDHSDYALTVAGVDQVESQSPRNHIFRELLTSGAAQPTVPPAGKKRVTGKAAANRPLRYRKRTADPVMAMRNWEPRSHAAAARAPLAEYSRR